MRRALRYVLFTLLAPGALLVITRDARADGEVWLWTENRLPIVRSERPTFPRLDWRVVTDFRINKRSEGQSARVTLARR